MIVAYNLFSEAVVTVGKGGGRPVFCFPIWPYQSLPNFLPVLLNPLVFLVWSTNTYHAADLGLNLGQNTITNHYRRGPTTHN